MIKQDSENGIDIDYYAHDILYLICTNYRTPDLLSVCVCVYICVCVRARAPAPTSTIVRVSCYAIINLRQIS